MDFDLAPEHEMFRKTVRDFAKKEIVPLLEEAEAKEEMPQGLFPRMGELGFLCVTCPEKYGGSGGDIITECIFSEEVGAVSLGIAIATSVHSAFGGLFVLNNGTEKQKEKYLPALVQGKKVWAFAGTEPDAGSDRSQIKTVVREEGDHFVLNGSKIFITNSLFADYIIVEARAEKTKGVEGISHFILEKGTPGFRASKLSKIGIRPSDFAELSFEDCIFPKENRLGVKGGGFGTVNNVRTGSWLPVSAAAIGVARAAFEATLEHAKTRVQHDRPIGHFQANSFRLAEMSLDIEIARMLTYRAAWLRDQGRECFKEASMAKLFTTEMAVRITGQALHMHGAYGLITESPVQRYFRDAQMLTIAEGSSEIQHIHLARQLGLRADDFYM